MSLFRRKKRGKIHWDVRVGCQWARCSCTDPPRRLEEDEVKNKIHMGACGEVRMSGVAKCKNCGQKTFWDTR